MDEFMKGFKVDFFLFTFK